MLRMGGFDVHSHVKWPYPKTRKCAGSKAWKYSSGWKNVRVAKAMATRMTRAIGIACCIKVAGSLITAKCQRGTLSAKNDGTVDLSRPAASEAARHCPVPQVSHKTTYRTAQWCQENLSQASQLDSGCYSSIIGALFIF